MSGEAESRSKLDLPGRQEELIKAVKATGKPFAVVLFNGRPLRLDEVAADSPAILEAWFPGVEAGNGVADVLYGAVNPGGKLPVSFPRNEGQVPVFYNHKPTGPAVRPAVEVQLALPGHPQLRAAVRVRLRPELHHVHGQARGHQLHPDGRAPGPGHGQGPGDQHRLAGRRRGRAAVRERPRGQHLAARPAAARVRARDAPARASRRWSVDAEPRRRGLLRPARALPRGERPHRHLRGQHVRARPTGSSRSR